MTPVVPPYRRGAGFGSLGVRFEEVVEPARVSFTPQTPGAWLTLIALAAGLLLAIGWCAWRWRKRRHRRVAQRELAALQRSWSGDPAALAALEAVPIVLKRCALSSFARERVASLCGPDWLQFLDATGRGPFGVEAGRALTDITTRGASAASATDVPCLFAAAVIWVRRHHADV